MTASSPARGQRRRRFAAAVIAAAAVAGALVALVTASGQANQVGSIDGDSVTREELAFHMQRLLPQFQNRFQLSGDVTDALWTASRGDGDSPVQELRAAAVEEARRFHALLDLAADEHLIDYRDFDGFQRALAAENADRAARIAAGEVVYGSRAFSTDSFFSHSVSYLREALEEKLAKTGVLAEPNDGDIDAYLDAHISDWSARAKRVQLTRLSVPLASDQLLLNSSPGTDFARIAAEQPGAVVSRETVTAETEHLSDGLALPPRLRDELLGLQLGEFSQPMTVAGQALVFRVDTVEVDREAAAREYRTEIAALLRSAEFDRLLEARVAVQNVTLLTKKIATITPKDPLP